MIKSRFSSVLATLLLSVAALASACGDPDQDSSPAAIVPDASGPHETTSAEYHLDAALDPAVLASAPTEAWAQVVRPRELGNTRHPVIVFLHGNHSTCGIGENPQRSASCEYTNTGSCPAGQAVVPSHLGYEYLANRLASWGYVVVSINANRGITCGVPESRDDEGLILARGRLVLRHLSLLSQWNRQGGAPPSLGVDLRGKLDLTQVGLMGHSRGGEGMRAAYNLYKDAGSLWPSEIGEPLHVRGIFEIAPVDGKSARQLDAVGTAWNVLLPTCDGDVVEWQGLKPYDRMVGASNEAPALPKSMYVVWGANHNYFNTAWQTSDSAGCVGALPLWNGYMGSAAQRQTALTPVVGFFRAHVGVAEERNPQLAALFDPMYLLPPSASQVTRIERTYIPSPASSHVQRIETFRGAAGIGSLGIPHESSGLTQVAHLGLLHHDPSLRVASVSWESAGSQVFFQDNWTDLGTGIDLGAKQSFDFRVNRVASPLNESALTDFGVRLVLPNGTLGPEVFVSDYATLLGPVGIRDYMREPLMTVRIPLRDLGGFAQARGVRFTFNRTARGLLYFADLTLSALGSDPWPGVQQAPLASSGPGGNMSVAQPITIVSGKDPVLPAQTRIVRVEYMANDPTRIEIEVESTEPFAVRDAWPELSLAGIRVAAGHFPRSGNLSRMVFRADAARISSLPANETGLLEAKISHSGDSSHEIRSLGLIPRSSLIPGLPGH